MATTKYVVAVDLWPQPVLHPNDPFRVVGVKDRKKGDVVDLDEDSAFSAEESGWAVAVGNRKPEDVAADVNSGKISFVPRGPDGVQVAPAPRYHLDAQTAAALVEGQALDVPEAVGAPNQKPGPPASQ